MNAELLNTLAEFFCDNAHRLTCTEAEAVAEAYRQAGDTHMAGLVISNHAEDDDEGDDHWRGESPRELRECPKCGGTEFHDGEGWVCQECGRRTH